MLKQLRNKKTAKRILIALAIIIIPAFVFWGSGSVMRSRQEGISLGKIYGKNISPLEYKDAMDAVKNIAILRFGDKLDEVKKYLNLEAQAWDRIILLQEAKRRKLNASDAEVVEFIENIPLFERKGQFDNKIYTEMLRYVLRTPARIFEEQIRQNILLQKLYKQVVDALTITPDELKEEYRRANEEVSVSYIAGLPAEFGKEIIAQEGELKDYFTKNSLSFKQPPSYNVEYLTGDSQEKITEAALRLRKNTDFNNVAKELGISAKETGLFNQIEAIPGIGWSPEISDLISKMKIGQLSSPIHMEKHYYILRLKEKKESYIPDFEKVKDKIRDSFIKEASREKAKKNIEDCLKELKTAPDFSRAAKLYGLKYGSTELFKYGSYIEGIGASDLLWAKAEKLKDNEISGAIDMPSGFYIIKLKSRVPLDEKKFSAEKEGFLEKLLEQKKEEYFSAFAIELKKKTGL